MSTDPNLTIAILQGYLRAIFHFPLPGGEKVDDLVCREDNKLYWAISAAVGESKEALDRIQKDIRDRHGKTLDKLKDMKDAPPPVTPAPHPTDKAGAK